MGDGEELARRVLAERGEAGDAERLGPEALRLPRDDAEAPDDPAAEVAEDVAPALRRPRAAAVDEPPNHWAVPLLPPVLVDGEDEPARARLARGEAARALVQVPAVVLQPARVARREVHLLDGALPNVRDVEIAGRAVEGVAPGVAQAEAEDRGLGPWTTDVQAQHLAERGVQVLRPVLRVASRAAVPEADPEPAVRAEDEVAAVVVGVRLVGEEEQACACRKRAAPVRAVAHHSRVACAVRVVHVHEAVRRIPRIEGEAEQALLTSRPHAFADVEEEAGPDTSALDHANRPALLHDVEPPRLCARRRHLDRRVEAASDRHAAKRRFGCRLLLPLRLRPRPRTASG